MAGGTWEVQNKIVPDVYTRVFGQQTNEINIGTRGVVAIARAMNWGDTSGIIEIEDTTNIVRLLGYDTNSEEINFLREIFLGTKEYNRSTNVLVDGSQRSDGASKILLYRLNGTGGAQATVTVDPLTVTAKYAGTRGNDIVVSVTPDPDTETEDEGVYAVMYVRTIVDGQIRNVQRVGSYTNATTYTQATVGDLVSNDWVNFSGTATAVLVPTTGATLIGGTNPTITNDSYATFLEELEKVLFNVLIFDGTDDVMKEIYSEFMVRMSAEKGTYLQLVTSNYLADSMYITSVKNGYWINDVQYPNYEATWWIGGCQAGCPLSRDLTNKTHPNATRVDTRYSTTELEDSILEGSLTLREVYNEVRITSDINTLVTYTDTMIPIMSKNHTIRTLWRLIDDAQIRLDRYIGQFKNNADTWDIIRADMIELLNEYVGLGAIDSFDPTQQMVVQGEQTDSVYVELNIVIGEYVLKIYVQINVQ